MDQHPKIKVADTTVPGVQGLPSAPLACIDGMKRRQALHP
jgi:hypothetical protein